MNNSKTIVLIVFAIFAIPAAILLGQWAATEPLYAGLSAFALIMLTVVFSLGKNLWLIIPFAYAWGGSIMVVPGGLAPRDLVVGFASAVMIGHWVVKRYPVNLRFGGFGVMLLIQFVFVIQAFVRNPVGIAFLKTERVGGRPYFELIIAAVAFLVLATQVVDLKRAKQAMWSSFGGAVTIGVFEAIVGFFPTIAFQTARFYRGVATTDAIRSAIASQSYGVVDTGIGRMMFLKFLPTPLITLIFAKNSPLQLVNPARILWVLLLLVSITLILLSGFRGSVVWVGFMVVAAALARRRAFEILIAIGLGVPLLSGLVLGQGTLFELPLAAQRALSFLPGDWNSRAIDAAEGTLEWRFEMWREALFSDRYIQNKWFGDGYGFTLKELNYQMGLQEEGFRASTLQEYYLMTGQYHSGPIETIRRVGYIGLIALIGGFFVAGRHAMRLIRASEGTPYRVAALYVGLPMLVFPFFFVLVFGEHQSALVMLCFQGGILKLTQTSIDNWRKAEAAESSNPKPTRIPAHRQRMPVGSM